MKKTFIIILIIFSACKPKDYRPTDLHLWFDDYMAAIKVNNHEKLLALFSQDVRFYRPNQPTFTGKENLSKWLIEYFNYYENISERLSVKEMIVKGDFAYVVCYYSVYGKVRESKNEFTDSGKSIYLFKQNFKGDWICTHTMWNNDNRSIDIHSNIPVNFSGNWQLDFSRSSKMPEIVSSSLFIVQSGNKITFNKSIDTSDKNHLKNSIEFLVGEEIKTTFNKDEYLTKSFWTEDKQSLVTVETILSIKNGISQKYVRKTQYSISAKGETLIVISDDIVPENSSSLIKDNHIELFYNKVHPKF